MLKFRLSSAITIITIACLLLIIFIDRHNHNNAQSEFVGKIEQLREEITILEDQYAQLMVDSDLVRPAQQYSYRFTVPQAIKTKTQIRRKASGSN